MAEQCSPFSSRASRALSARAAPSTAEQCSPMAHGPQGAAAPPSLPRSPRLSWGAQAPGLARQGPRAAAAPPSRPMAHGPRGAAAPPSLLLRTPPTIVALLLLLLLLSGSPTGVIPQAEAALSVCKTSGPAAVTIDASKTSSFPWKGVGTSLCWFANYIGGLPPANLNTLLDLLFLTAPNGAGLNMVRYNIGGGYNPKNSPQFNTSSWIRLAGLPGFKASESAPYNWSQDANQRAVLLGARDRGANVFVAFSNSPPWWMTKSGDVAGSSTGGDNLKPEYYQAFADYLADVVLQYKTNPAWNIPFQYLEPVNEPVESWWRQGNNQEGCHFGNDSLAKLYPILRTTVTAKGLKKISLVGIDSWLNSSAKTLSSMPQSVVASSMDGFQAHGYIAPGSTPGASEKAGFERLKPLVDAFKKEVWVSEWGPWYGGTDQLTVSLNTAFNIIQGINFLGISGWSLWQAMDPKKGEEHWPIVSLNAFDYSAPFGYSIRKHFYVIQQFTTHAPFGSLTITPDFSKSDCRHGMVAFYVPAPAKKLVIYAANASNSTQTVTVTLKGFAKASSFASVQLQTFRTSGTENNVASPKSRVDIRQPLVLKCVGSSVSTFVLYNIVKV